MISDEIKKIIEPELIADEKLIWTGKPMRFPIMYDGFFGIAFLILWVVITFRHPDIPIVFTLVGLLGLLSAINYVLKPNREAYGLTDKRGFVINRLLGKRIHFLSDSDIRSASLAKDSQIGTLNFNFTSFHNVENPKDVLEIIKNQILPNGATP